MNMKKIKIREAARKENLLMEFYLSIPEMLQSLGILNYRESDIMQRLIKGDDISLAMEQLSEAVDQDGNVVNAIPLDMDLMEKPETLKLLQYKAEEANNILDDLDDKDRFKQFLHFDGRYARGLADKIIISKNKAL